MPVIHRVRVDFNIPGHPTQQHRLRVEEIPPTELALNNGTARKKKQFMYR